MLRFFCLCWWEAVLIHISNLYIIYILLYIFQMLFIMLMKLLRWFKAVYVHIQICAMFSFNFKYVMTCSLIHVVSDMGSICVIHILEGVRGKWRYIYGKLWVWGPWEGRILEIWDQNFYNKIKNPCQVHPYQWFSAVLPLPFLVLFGSQHVLQAKVTFLCCLAVYFLATLQLSF